VELGAPWLIADWSLGFERSMEPDTTLTYDPPPAGASDSSTRNRPGAVFVSVTCTPPLASGGRKPEVEGGCSEVGAGGCHGRRF
jgi:hypothetical protein